MFQNLGWIWCQSKESRKKSCEIGREQRDKANEEDEGEEPKEQNDKDPEEEMKKKKHKRTTW